ncbi:uncharacterized protein LOC114304778, partial [Camellia sinensis]|uniref:uncharacterized protein LOC114304778 n=1 Tax=Camellia sinensis TaxID=4442 RepID=UPI001035DAF8
MAILGRLNTGDRLHLFGVTQSTVCVFCQYHNEDHNHLFFECPFSERVWSCIKGKINVDRPSLLWDDLVQAKSVKGNSLGTIITKLAFTCTAYQLWVARNNRVFSKDIVPEGVVIKCIVDMVRFRQQFLDGAAWFVLQFGLTRSSKLDMIVLMAAICASCVKIDFPL